MGINHVQMLKMFLVEGHSLTDREPEMAIFSVIGGQ